MVKNASESTLRWATTGPFALLRPECLASAISRGQDQADVVERVIYWHGDSGEARWLTTEKPSPFNMLPVPTLNESQWQALNTVIA